MSYEQHGVVHHKRRDYLVNILIMLKTKKWQCSALLALCEGNTSVTRGMEHVGHKGKGTRWSQGEGNTSVTRGRVHVGHKGKGTRRSQGEGNTSVTRGREHVGHKGKGTRRSQGEGNTSVTRGREHVGHKGSVMRKAFLCYDAMMSEYDLKLFVMMFITLIHRLSMCCHTVSPAPVWVRIPGP